jgi:hypothetical protein
MDRQHNGQEKKNSTTNHDLQNITHKTKDRVTRTPLKTGGQLRCCVRLSSSCSTSVSRRVNLVTNSVISHEWGKDREVFTTRGTNPWWFVTYIFHTGQLSHGGDRKTFEMMASTSYGVYISQLIRYSRAACGSYHDFLHRGMLLIRRLLNRGSLLSKLKPSFRKFYGRHHDLIDRYGIYMSQITTDLFLLS